MMKFSMQERSLLAEATRTKTLTLQFTYIVGLILIQLSLNFDPGVSAALTISSSRIPETHGSPTIIHPPQIVPPFSVNGPVPHNRIFYSNGMNDTTLPECEVGTVCAKIDVYDKPWMERQCRCPSSPHSVCSSSTSSSDGHTIVDKSRLYKMCEPVRKLGKCRYFRDVTWVLTTIGDSVVSQVVNCVCPKDAVAYMIKRQAYTTPDDQVGFKYSFACSPQSRVLCGRKEPCRLFTVKRRRESSGMGAAGIMEVNTSTLCGCPRGFECPAHHTDSSVIGGKFYPENGVRTFSAYCV